jgi:alkanesulfonate monooxygenase SsuD/methylene tetrahydromethanopterin reductase-like flavin-dependent oxidoreductase (luciferase family)
MGPLPSVEEASARIFTESEQTLIDESMSSHLIGSPDNVYQGLMRLIDRVRANEVMISTRTHSYEARAHSYELVAHRWASF